MTTYKYLSRIVGRLYTCFLISNFKLPKKKRKKGNNLGVGRKKLSLWFLSKEHVGSDVEESV